MSRATLIVACLLLGWNAHRAYLRHQAACPVEADEPETDDPEPWYIERVVRDMAYRTRWDC